MISYWGVFSIATVWLFTLAWYDWRVRRLPNWLTLPAVPIALLAYYFLFGWQGAKMSLIGCGVGTLFLLIPYLLRGAGAGDVKMLAAVGSIVAFPQILYALVLTSIAGLLLGLYMYLARKADGARLKHWLRCCVDFRYDRKAGAAALKAQNKRNVFIPYGVAIAAGTWGSYIWMLCLTGGR